MSSPWRRWLPVVVWVAVIYTTIPFVRMLREWYVERWDPIFIGIGVAATLTATSVAVLLLLSRKPGGLSMWNTAWIIGATAILVVWTFSLRHSPEEAVHFLEYGILAILLHRALLPSMPNSLVFVAAALVGVLIGTVDEVIQWLSPDRYWDWRDLLLNGGGGALVQVMLWRIVKPPTHRPDSASLRVVLRLTVVQLVLLTLSLANTPIRVERYAPHLPGGGHLTSTRNPMAEYGYRHDVPHLGFFKSRLTLEEIRHEDTRRSIEVAALIDAHRHSYGVFLDTWPVGEDPFTYEARIHLYARDRNLGKARERRFTGAVAAEQISIAWFENRLIEEFFGDTLGTSSYRWRQRLFLRVESAHDPDYLFGSAAGSHLITVASERTIRSVLLMLVAAMIGADLLIGRSGRRQE